MAAPARHALVAVQQCIRPVRGLISIESRRSRSTTPLTKDGLREFMANPKWSVSSLNEKPKDGKDEEKITREKLHHLLRLSALPLPSSPEEEKKMIVTLESQLRFVKAIQKVDTTGVKPLASVRDETTIAESENEVDLDTLKEQLSDEEIVGFAHRITRKSEEIDTSDVETGDPLGQAPKKLGRFITVNTKTA